MSHTAPVDELDYLRRRIQELEQQNASLSQTIIQQAREVGTARTAALHACQARDQALAEATRSKNALARLEASLLVTAASPAPAVRFHVAACDDCEDD